MRVASTNSCAHLWYYRMRGYALPSSPAVIHTCDNLPESAGVGSVEVIDRVACCLERSMLTGSDLSHSEPITYSGPSGVRICSIRFSRNVGGLLARLTICTPLRLRF